MSRREDGLVERWIWRDRDALFEQVGRSLAFPEPQVLRVHVSGADAGRPLARMLSGALDVWLRRTSRSHRTDVLDLTADYADGDEADVPGAVERAIQRALGLVVPPRTTFVRALAERCTQSPLLLLLVSPLGQEQDLYDAASLLADRVRNLKPGAGLLLLLLGRAFAPGDELLDFGVAFAPGIVVRDLRPDLSQIWASYLEVRAGWEVAGDIVAAANLLDELGGVAQRDDTAVESLLNERAIKRWRELTPAFGAVAPSLPSLLAARPRTSRGQRIDARVLDAREAGLLWRPGGNGGWRPVPWLARARLLDGGLSDAERRLHRWSMRCAPLATDLMSGVLELEAELRSVVPLPASGPPEGGPATCEACGLARGEGDDLARANHQLRRRSEERGYGRYYTSASPDPPADAWDMMTIGQVCVHAWTDVEEPHEERPSQTLIWLRNALAHNHRVGWRSVEDFWNCRRTWDRDPNAFR